MAAGGFGSEFLGEASVASSCVSEVAGRPSSPPIFVGEDGSFALPFIVVAPILLIQILGLALFSVEYARRTLDSTRQ